MLTITVDTNVVWDCVDSKRPRHTLACDLMQLDDAGACEVRVVSRINADVGPGLIRTKMEALSLWLRPMIPCIGQWDMSRWDQDVWATEKQAETFNALFHEIFPNVRSTSKNHRRRLVDVGHLFGHVLANRDIFVSSDGAFIRARSALLSKFSVNVLSLVDAVREIKHNTS